MIKWLLIVRAPFLLLPVVLAFLGTSIAWYEGYLNLGFALLAFFGLLLAHISVNVFNEYFDYKSGVDFHTQRTPFSGGSGALPSNLLKPKQALWLANGSLVVIVPIGIYFCIARGWLLLPLLLAAALCIVLYTPFILKVSFPEWAPGLGLGFLPVLGAYFVQTGSYSLPAVVAAVPPGILVCNLLLLNEFPDAAPDSQVGWRSIPIVIGKDRAAVVYSMLTLLVYVWIAVFSLVRILPPYTLLALLTLPLAIKAIQGALNHNDMSKLVPGMASNVIVVLLTQLLMGIGYILSKVF